MRRPGQGNAHMQSKGHADKRKGKHSEGKESKPDSHF